MTMYGEFAGVYDALMADVDYPAWAAYYVELAKHHGVTGQRAAECACGTGCLTLALAKRGLQMTGLDLSADMLRVAGQKARASGLQIPFVRQDMRALKLHRPMDAIFCGCDGANYLTEPRDVQDFFRAAYASLRPGGGLFFDVSTQHKLSHILGNHCLGNDGDAVSYIWQNHYDASKRIVQMDMTFFVRGDGGLYRRFGETHWQRAHTETELADWLGEAGFDSITIYGDKRFATPNADEERIHIAAMRA